MQKMERWQTDIQNWTVLTKDMVNFYLAQAEADLKNTLDLHDKITARAFTLLGIMLPIATVQVAYLVRCMEAMPKDRFLVNLTFGGLAVAVACLLVLIRLIFPRKWFPAGAQPRRVFTSSEVDSFSEADYTDEQKYVGIAMRQIEDIQFGIDQNDVANGARLKRLKMIIVGLTLAFAFVLVLLVRQFLFF